MPKARANTKPKSEAEVVVEKEEQNGEESHLPAIASSPATLSEGTYALAMLSDEEFKSRMLVLKRGRDRVQVLQRELMVPEEDYGLIPNTPKPTLFKSGAEKLCQFYRLAAEMKVQRIDGDNETSPPLTFDAQCYLHLGDTDGPVVATGHGTANGWEKRYLRGGSKKCPKCEAVGSLIVAKFGKYPGGWHCFAKKGGCSTDFPKDDPEIASQTDTKGAVTDAHDLGNTLMKMAEKRAFVDATLRATATSGLFTQDVAEDPRDDEDTVVTSGGAVVDGSTGEVRGRQDVAMMEAVAPGADTLEAQDAAGDQDAAATASLNEMAAAGSAADPATGKIDADAIDTKGEPEFRPSNVEGIGRGGVTEKATSAQIEEVKKLAREVPVEGQDKPGLGPWRLADEIAELFQGGIDSTTLPDDRGGAGREVATFLHTMSADDMGKLITHLRKMGG